MWQQLVTPRKSQSGMQVPVKVHARVMVRCILVVHVSLAMNTADGLDELVKPVRFSRQLEHILCVCVGRIVRSLNSFPSLSYSNQWST